MAKPLEPEPVKDDPPKPLTAAQRKKNVRRVQGVYAGLSDVKNKLLHLQTEIPALVRTVEGMMGELDDALSGRASGDDGEGEEEEAKAE